VVKGSVPLAVLRSLPGFLQKAGVDSRLILARAGISEEPNDSFEKRITRSQVATALTQAAGCLDEADFHLRLGATAPLGAMNPAARSLLATSTVRAGVCRGIALMNTHHQGTIFSLYGKQGEIHFGIDCSKFDPNLARQYLDLTMLRIRRIAGIFGGPEFRCLRVVLPYQRPRSDENYQTAFDAPVTFGGDHFRLVIPAGWLDQPWRQVAMPQQAQAPVEKMTAITDNPLIQKIACIVDGMLSMDRISFKETAKILEMPARSLQRHLAAAGVSFEQIADGRRRERARDLLADSDMRIGDVAALSGYADGAHFTRACRRWFAMSPYEFRSTQRAGG